jgi:antitoxin component HigA of HigAB toxin-antitoxin module
VNATGGGIAAEEETYPPELVERLVRGDNPIRVWREFRGMTTAGLAAAVGVTSSAISQIEGCKRGLSVDLLKNWRWRSRWIWTILWTDA